MAATALARFTVAPKSSWNVSGMVGDNMVGRSISLQKSVSPGGLKVKLNERKATCPSLGAKGLGETADVWAFVDPSWSGKMLPDGFVFRQSFPVRSYEVGADRKASIEWFMNHLQETTLNHLEMAGFAGTSFGLNEAMSKRNLIWVMMKIHVVVNQYPFWGDVVQIDTWMYANGKNSVSSDWRILNSITGETLAEASGSWVVMNTITRRLARIPDDIQRNLELMFINSCVPILENNKKLQKLDESTVDNFQNGLTSRWCDLDLNQHVNNTKYIGWILESCSSMLESHELVGLTLEYRKECRKDNVMQSLTALCKEGTENGWPERVHLLRLDNGTELVRGRTTWRPKYVNKYV